MNLFADGSDSWDSTPTQDEFIQNYFRKDEPSNNIVTKRSRKRKKHPLSSGTVSTNLMSNFHENEIPKQKNKNKKAKLTSTSCLETISAKSNMEENIADSDVTADFVNKNFEFKSSEPGSPKKKILTKKFRKKNLEMSDNTKKDSNDINLFDKSPKRYLQNNDSPSKKVNSKKNNKSNTNEASQNMLFVGETNFQLKTTQQQNLKKLNSKSNKASKIQNKPFTAESNNNTKNLKVAKKTDNLKENGLNVHDSDGSEAEAIEIERQNQKKGKSKASKLMKTDESEDYEYNMFQKKQKNLKKRKSKTGKLSQTDELKDPVEEFSHNDMQKQKKKKSKTGMIKNKLSANETTNLKTKKVKGSKNLSNSKENCLNVDDSEDDEVIRNELQNTRMFLKIQKLMKVAPHLNPNFHKDLGDKDEDLSLEEISTEDSSSESDGEYASESENEEVLNTNNIKHSSEIHSDVLPNDNEDDSPNDNEDDSPNDNEDDFSESEDEDMEDDPTSKIQESHPTTSKQEIPIPKLEIYSQKTSTVKKPNSMLEKARAKLAAAKFRFLNEKLYTESGGEAFRYFQENKEEFEDYHLGYSQQVSKWPLNPVDEILADLQKMNKNAVIADLGCGEAKIARVLTSRTVHSFDLVAMHKCVTSCDISKVPLRDGSVDVAVFCLSLMGVNLVDYLCEAYRILKIGGTLKIAEVESRVENLDLFIKNLSNLGFVLERKNLKHKLFVLLDLKKEKKGKQAKGTTITLRPCMYKKR